MKVILISNRSNIGISVPIKQDMKACFIEMLKSQSNSAFLAIKNDVYYYRKGFVPLYISKYSAKRIASYVGDSDFYKSFKGLVYENR